jgi:hypothetical protein
MAQVVQTNGNYTIKTASSGIIKLDTGAGTGEVRVTGNLVVDGTTVTIEAENINVQDNILVLNAGETANGVSLGYSGFEIDRGYAAGNTTIINVTGASWSNGTATLTFSLTNPQPFQVGERVVISGINPSGYNLGGVSVELTTANTVSVSYPVTANPGAYVSGGVISGSSANSRASFAFNEATDTFEIAKRTGPGVYNFSDSAIKTRFIRTDPAIDEGDLILIGTGKGVVKVTGTTDYLTEILLTIANPSNPPASSVTATLADDILANVKYVNYAVLNNPTYFLRDNDTTVRALDSSDKANLFGGGSSRVRVDVDGVIVAQFFRDNLEMYGLNFSPNRISSTNTNESITLEANGTGRIVVNAPLSLENEGSTPATPPAGRTLVYSATPGTGDSGVFFVNTSRTNELTNKNRALLWSMLF